MTNLAFAQTAMWSKQNKILYGRWSSVVVLNLNLRQNQLSGFGDVWVYFCIMLPLWPFTYT